MTTLGRVLRLAALPLHPLLAAAYPVVFLYAQNVKEAIAPQEVLVPLGISLGATILALIILRALSGSWPGAALMSTLLVALFFTYGMAWEVVGGMLPGHWALLAAWGLLAVIGVAMVWRFRGLAERAALPLNVIGLLLLGANLVVIGSFLLDLRPAAGSSLSGVTASGEAGGEVKRPDVYWIVLEEYGSESVLREYFDYDNTPFLDALRQRGFYVADDATANYLKTAPSIQSARNLEYLDGAQLRAQAKSSDDWGPIYRALRSPFEVQRFLDRLGYRFIYAGTFWSPMGKHPSAEFNYIYDRLTSEFVEVLQRATLLRAFENLGAQAPNDWRRNRWDQTLYELRSIAHAADLAGPKFVHVQLALNHEPYVFHADGSFVIEAEERARSHEANYIDQLKYTNAQMLAFVDKLLDVPPDERPIILLLADEGPWPYGYRRDERGFDWTTATPDDLKLKFGILSATYLPGSTGEEVGLYSAISPVNMFRVIFDAYFGLDLPLLPDRNYIWRTQDDIYTYIDVTDRLRGGPQPRATPAARPPPT
jgi:hypothetical protein